MMVAKSDTDENVLGKNIKKTLCVIFSSGTIKLQNKKL